MLQNVDQSTAKTLLALSAGLAKFVESLIFQTIIIAQMTSTGGDGSVAKYSVNYDDIANVINHCLQAEQSNACTPRITKAKSCS